MAKLLKMIMMMLVIMIMFCAKLDQQILKSFFQSRIFRKFSLAPKPNTLTLHELKLNTTYRSRRSQMFFKIGVLKKPLFNKAAKLKKDSSTGVSCEICEIFKNTSSYRTPPVAASI